MAFVGIATVRKIFRLRYKTTIILQCDLGSQAGFPPCSNHSSSELFHCTVWTSASDPWSTNNLKGHSKIYSRIVWVHVIWGTNIIINYHTLTGRIVRRSMTMPILVIPRAFEWILLIALSKVHVAVEVNIRPTICFVVEDPAVPPFIAATNWTMMIDKQRQRHVS